VPSPLDIKNTLENLYKRNIVLGNKYGDIEICISNNLIEKYDKREKKASTYISFWKGHSTHTT
jgi:hypothetical protein